MPTHRSEPIPYAMTGETLRAYVDDTLGSRETAAPPRRCCAKCRTPYNCGNTKCRCHGRKR